MSRVKRERKHELLMANPDYVVYNPFPGVLPSRAVSARIVGAQSYRWIWGRREKWLYHLEYEKSVAAPKSGPWVAARVKVRVDGVDAYELEPCPIRVASPASRVDMPGLDGLL